MTEDEYKEILEVVKSIKNSPAMNGAFDKLVTSVEEIGKTQTEMAMDVKLMKSQQEESMNRIQELHDVIYDPDLGIYKRINDSINVGLNQEDHLKNIDEKIETVNHEALQTNERLIKVESTREDLVEVAGERMENLDSTIKMNKNINKLIWAGVFAVGAFILKELGPTILALLL
jgi:hypothetical protein